MCVCVCVCVWPGLVTEPYVRLCDALACDSATLLCTLFYFKAMDYKVFGCNPKS